MPTYADIESPVVNPNAIPDFWRSAAGTTLPNGVTDTTDAILHQGLVALGAGAPLADPVASLDVFSGARSGTDGRVAGVTPLYVTGPLPAVPGVACPAATPVGGAEIIHSNQTQGIGFGFNGIYATGSTPNQDFSFLGRGNGQFSFGWQAKNVGNLDYMNYHSPVAIAAGQGFITRNWQACVNIAEQYTAYVESIGPTNVRNQWDITANGTLQAALRLSPSRDCTGTAVGTCLEVGENQIINKKLVLFGVGTNDQDQFYGFGINGGTLRYQIAATTSINRWYAGTGACTSQEIFAVTGLARVIVDPAGLNTGACTSGYLAFGTEAANGPTIFSKRNAGGNQNGLDFTIGCTPRLSIGGASGKIRMNYFGPTQDTVPAYPGSSSSTPQVYIDKAGTVGNEQSPLLGLALENCGSPCGQIIPPAIAISNNNGTSLGLSQGAGRIAWFDPTKATQTATIGDSGTGILDIIATNTTRIWGTTGTVQLLTNNIVRMTVRNNGIINIANLPVFLTDAAAGVGGLVSGDLWRDAAGLVHAKI